MDIFTIIFYQPIFNLLIVFYRMFGGNLALALVSIALISRLITFPITTRQIKMAEQSKEMNVRMKQIKEKYKNNKEKQNEEMIKLQSEYLPGQLAGCLPLIVQFILFISMFSVINNLFLTGTDAFNLVAYNFVPSFAAGETINSSFLGIIDLSRSAQSIGYDNLLSVAPYVILAILVGLSQYLSTKILMGMREKKGKAGDEAKQKKDDKDKKKGNVPEDFGEIMQRSTQQTMMVLPLLLVFMALNLPAGLSLYWTVQSGFVIIQQFVIERMTSHE